MATITVPPNMILKLADEHIQMYSRRLENPGPMVRVGETTAYLRLWESIKAKNGLNLSLEESSEVMDAISCGDYDEILEDLIGA